jgi:hypothetical protein
MNCEVCEAFVTAKFCHTLSLVPWPFYKPDFLIVVHRSDAVTFPFIKLSLHLLSHTVTINWHLTEHTCYSTTSLTVLIITTVFVICNHIVWKSHPDIYIWMRVECFSAFSYVAEGNTVCPGAAFSPAPLLVMHTHRTYSAYCIVYIRNSLWLRLPTYALEVRKFNDIKIDISQTMNVSRSCTGVKSASKRQNNR